MTDWHPINQAFSRLRAPHSAGHRCYDGTWHNPNTGDRRPCPVTVDLAVIADALRDIDARVFHAATDPEAVHAVATGATGLILRDLPPAEGAGWYTTFQMAITALDRHLRPEATHEVVTPDVTE